MRKTGRFLFLLLLTATMCQQVEAQAGKRPNIIIILADDLGWGDVGYHGSKISTPNINKLSKEGVILNHYYTAPVCSPTRAGLLTGRYPNRYGLRQTVIPPWSDFGVDTTEQYIPEMLASAGYTNRAMIGKWHLGHAKKKYLPMQRGFTHFYGHYNGAINYFTHEREGQLDWHNDNETSNDKGYATDLLSDEAVRCVQQYAGAKEPFFMYVAYNAPHSPLQAKEEDLLLYGYDSAKPTFGKEKGGDEEGGNDDNTLGRGNTKWQTYAAMVTCMDRGIGKIMDAIRKMGIEENTLVLFHSDNGAAPNEGGSSGNLRGLKFQEWDGGVRAPAIVKWPAGFKGGRTENQVMGYIDVAPTIRAIVGISQPPAKPYDGLNMLPVLKEPKKNIARNLYLGYGSMVNNDWKIIRAKAGNPRMEISEDHLFSIMKDEEESKNLRASKEDVYQDLLNQVSTYDSIKSNVAVPPYGHGRKGFKAPKDWVIKE